MSTSDDAVVAGLLAEEFADSPAAVSLKIREAELTTVRTHAAAIAVELYDSGRLPVDRFAWMEYDDCIAENCGAASRDQARGCAGAAKLRAQSPHGTER